MNEEKQLSVESIRAKRLAALCCADGGTVQRSPPVVESLSTVPITRPHAVAPSSSSSSTTSPALPCSPTVQEEFEIYVSLPSRDITAIQFYHYVIAQFGVEIVVKHFNSKFDKFTGDRNFCFILCNSEDDMCELLERMEDAEIGEFPDTIRVKRVVR